MTEEALESVRVELIDRKPQHVVHGDCVGSDEQFHEIALQLGIPIVIRPCDLIQFRANCEGAIFRHKIRPPLWRNHDIVDDCTILIAAPDGPERLRSGTWATVRYAIKKDREVTFV